MLFFTTLAAEILGNSPKAQKEFHEELQHQEWMTPSRSLSWGTPWDHHQKSQLTRGLLINGILLRSLGISFDRQKAAFQSLIESRVIHTPFGDSPHKNPQIRRILLAAHAGFSLNPSATIDFEQAFHTISNLRWINSQSGSTLHWDFQKKFFPNTQFLVNLFAHLSGHSLDKLADWNKRFVYHPLINTNHSSINPDYFWQFAQQINSVFAYGLTMILSALSNDPEGSLAAVKNINQRFKLSPGNMAHLLKEMGLINEQIGVSGWTTHIEADGCLWPQHNRVSYPILELDPLFA